MAKLKTRGTTEGIMLNNVKLEREAIEEMVEKNVRSKIRP